MAACRRPRRILATALLAGCLLLDHGRGARIRLQDLSPPVPAMDAADAQQAPASLAEVGGLPAAAAARAPPRKRTKSIGDSKDNGAASGEVAAPRATAAPAEAIARVRRAALAAAMCRPADPAASGPFADLKAPGPLSRDFLASLGGALRSCEADMRPVVDELLKALPTVREQDTQAAIVDALGAAALGPDSISAGHAIWALGQAAQLEGVAVDHGSVWDIVQCLCRAIGGAAPANAKAAVKALMWTLVHHSDGNLSDMAIVEVGAALQQDSTGGAAAALLELIKMVEASEENDGGEVALSMLCSAVRHGTATTVGAIIAAILRAAQAWEIGSQQRLLQELESWLVESSPHDRDAGRVVLEVVADRFQGLDDPEFRQMLVVTLTRVLDESFTAGLERPAISALGRVAARSSDQALERQVVDTLHMGLWLGTVDGRNVVHAMRALVRIGTASSSANVKRSVVDALWHHIWDRAGSGIWSARVVEYAVGGMGKVAGTTNETAVQEATTMNLAEIWTKRPLPEVRRKVLGALRIDGARGGTAEIVERVGGVIANSIHHRYLARAVDWMLQEELCSSEDEVVRRAVVDVIASLGTPARIELTLEALLQDLAEAWEGPQRDGLRRFVEALLVRCSLKSVKRAVAQLTAAASERTQARVQRELVGWLVGTLRVHPDARAAGAIVSGLVELGITTPSVGLKAQIVTDLRSALGGLPDANRRTATAGLVRIAMWSRAAEVELPVAEALGDQASSGDARRKRSAIRSLAKLASTTDSADVGQALANRLAGAMRDGDEANARLALRGLLEASAQGNADFLEQSWAMAVNIWQRPMQLALPLEELADALVELMRRREEQMDRDSRRPEARNSAHAA